MPMRMQMWAGPGADAGGRPWSATGVTLVQIQEQEGSLCVLKAELARLTPELETLRDKVSIHVEPKQRRRPLRERRCTVL